MYILLCKYFMYKYVYVCVCFMKIQIGIFARFLQNLELFGTI